MRSARSIARLYLLLLFCRHERFRSDSRAAKANALRERTSLMTLPRAPANSTFHPLLSTRTTTPRSDFSRNHFDIGKRNTDGSIDIPRMREGGMNGIFFSIWIDGKTLGPPAIQKALDQIDSCATMSAKIQGHCFAVPPKMSAAPTRKTKSPRSWASKAAT